MISVRENILRAYRHQETAWVPFIDTDVHSIFCPALGDAPRPNENGELFDGFGVKWIPQENTGNMVDETIPPVIEDIEDWREKLVLPDIESFDWEKAGAEANAIWEKEDKLRTVPFFNGLWERFYFLCGFENALCNTMIDPEETFALLSCIADLRVREIELVGKYYKPDKIFMHDDYGFDTTLMISEETWRELVKPNLKRIVDAMHEYNIIYEHHSCGYTAPLIEDLIELGVDALQPVHPTNKPFELKKKYGSKICFQGGFDSQGVYDNDRCTYEMAYEETMRTLRAMAPGGSYVVQHPNMVHGKSFEVSNRGFLDALNEYNAALKGN